MKNVFFFFGIFTCLRGGTWFSFCEVLGVFFFFLTARSQEFFICYLFLVHNFFNSKRNFFPPRKTPEKNKRPWHACSEMRIPLTSQCSNVCAITTRRSHQPQPCMTKCPYFNLFTCLHYPIPTWCAFFPNEFFFHLNLHPTNSNTSYSLS